MIKILRFILRWICNIVIYCIPIAGFIIMDLFTYPVAFLLYICYCVYCFANEKDIPNLTHFIREKLSYKNGFYYIIKETIREDKSEIEDESPMGDDNDDIEDGNNDYTFNH